MQRARALFGVLLISVPFAFVACGDDEDDGDGGSNGGSAGAGKGGKGGTAGTTTGGKGGTSGSAGTTGGTGMSGTAGSSTGGEAGMGGAGGEDGGQGGQGGEAGDQGGTGGAGMGGIGGALAGTGGVAGTAAGVGGGGMAGGGMAGGGMAGGGMAGGGMAGSGGANPTCDPTDPPAIFVGVLDGAQEVPAVVTTATGVVIAELNDAETQLTTSIWWSGLTSNTSLGHIHGPAVAGMTNPPIFNYNPPTNATSGSVVAMTVAITATQVGYLKNAELYANIHSVNNGAGEIRAQLLPATVLRTGTLTAAQETSAVTSSATGRAVVVVFPNNTQAVATVTWSGLTTGTSAGHIHGSANFGATASPMLDLVPPLTMIFGSVVHKLWDMTGAHSTALLGNLTYANIHSTMYTTGEIRAQLLPPCL